MNNEIKEILDMLKDSQYIPSDDNRTYKLLDRDDTRHLLDHITNLQQDYDNEVEENLKLSEWLVEKQQRIEGLEAENETLRSDFKNQVEYTNKIAEENERLKELNENASKVCMAEHRYGVDKAEEARDYKFRCEKANNQLKIIMQIIKEQPARNVEDDEWIENRLIGIVNILQNGSDKE